MDLTGLTSEQQAVVTHRDGPAVVVACPGSGKTRALTHRIAFLVREDRVRPHQVLGITFTRAAAREMKERLALLLDPARTRRLRLFTFHGLAWRLIRERSGPPNLLDGQAQQGMVREIMKEMGVNADQTAVDSLLTDIACFVGGQIPRDRFQPGSLDPELFFQLWDRYIRRKAEFGCLDFDDLIVRVIHNLEGDSTRREAIVQETRHLLVDEFQDTNALQWRFLELICPSSRNLMVVGDDDQAIYSWRGSSPDFMLNFRRRVPDATQFHLSRNFRSAFSLFAPAARLIDHNRARFPKELEAERPAALAPMLIRPAGAAEEADEVLSQLRDYLAAGGDPAAAAVLYRAGMTAYPLINRMERAALPFRVLGERPNPFSRWMVRDMLSYIRWAHGQAGIDEILRLLRRPARRGVGRELLGALEAAHPAPGEVLDWLVQNTSAHTGREIVRLSGQLAQVQALPASRVISYICEEMEYDRYVQQYCDWSGSDPREAREVLDALAQIPESHEAARFFLDLAAREEPAARPEAGGAQITLSTLHGAKGMEWKNVWILGAVEGGLPHRRTLESGSAAALEEERRLFYVGMTRARDALCVSAPRALYGSGAEVSRFLRESGIWSPPPPPPPPARVRGRRGESGAGAIRTDGSPAGPGTAAGPLPPPLAASDYAPGVLCWHALFGTGVIHRVDGRSGIVEVHFRSDPGKKVLSLKYALARGLLRQPLEP